MTSLQLTTDNRQGGRWVSLKAEQKEWLWQNPHAEIRAQRQQVQPGQAFVDAGGGEECFPQLRKPDDHGQVWSRPWDEIAADTAQVTTREGITLTRRITHQSGKVVIDYSAARPEFAAKTIPSTQQNQVANDFADTPELLPFNHNAHLLLDLSSDAQLLPGSYQRIHYWSPQGESGLPEAQMIKQIAQGPTSAVCYSFLDCAEVALRDGGQELKFELSSDDDLPFSFVIWRNLGGFPVVDPYYSFGIEPSVGWDVDQPGELATEAEAHVWLRAGERKAWRLTVTATTLNG